MANKRIGVVGATGAVGQTMISVLVERGVNAREIRAIASERSAGKAIRVGDGEAAVLPLSPEVFDDLDFALFALDDGLAREWVPVARKKGVVVVDNSAVYRLDPTVPLVVPEVNGRLLGAKPSLVANPNCSTIVLVVALAPIAREAGVKRIVAATYQSASGAGQAALDELDRGARAALAGEPVPADVFPAPLAFNCLPQVGGLTESGQSREERKMVDETRRILDAPNLPASFTCVRVPTRYAHAVAAHVETVRPVSVERVAELLSKAPGVTLGSPEADAPWPTPLSVAGRDEVYVGRLRKDEAFQNGLAFWVVGDNLRKGAATNAIQIAESLWG